MISRSIRVSRTERTAPPRTMFSLSLHLLIGRSALMLLLLSFPAAAPAQPALPGLAQAGPNAQKLLTTRRIELELHLKRIIPAEVTVEEGLYEIRLINTTYTGSLQLLLDTEGTALRVGDKFFDGTAAKVRPVFDLKPGRHIASIAGRPDLRTVLIVTKKP